MSVRQNLSDLLHNEETALENRLKIVSSTFSVPEFGSIKNKEIALSWLQELLRNGREEYRDDIYNVLKNCIMNATDVWLHPHLNDPIISMLTTPPCTRNVIDCCVELLKGVHFLRYFIHNVNKMADIMVFVINSIHTSTLESELITKVHESIIDCILNVKSNALYNSDLKIVFCKDLLPSLTLIVDHKEELTGSVEDCVYQVLFSEAEFRNTFTNRIFSCDQSPESDREQYVDVIIDCIRNYPALLSNEMLASSYALLFAAFSLSNAKSDCKFKVFVALNTFINVSPCPSKQITIDEKTIVTTNALMEKLLKFDLPSDSTTNSFTLLDWLNALVDVLLDSINGSLNVHTLKLLRNVLNSSPFVMENCIKKFAKTVMMLKKSDERIISTYSLLCLDVLNVHIKLNRMHKLISALLVTVNENLSDFDHSSIPDKFDILPMEIFEKIQSAVTNLPSTVQNVALLNTLLYHLEKDCIAKLKADTSKRVDHKLVLVFDIVTYLISRFISGTRIVDHSVPDLVRDKFESLMSNLALLLGEFGKAMIAKEHSSKLMESFLHLCYVWGDIQMMSIVYESSRRRVPKQAGNIGKSATNLVYLHPYLTDFHWETIAQRVVNFGDESCHNLLNNLVLQKIHALPHLEDEVNGPYLDEGPATVCAHYLLNQADGKWLFSHLTEFIHLLKTLEVFTLSKTLVNYYENCDEEVSIGEDFQEMRPLVLGMLCSAFHSIGRQFAKSNVKELKRIMRKINLEQMLEAESEGDDKQEAIENINASINEIGSLISNDFDYVDQVADISIERQVSLLVSLPAAFLSKENKSVIFYLTLSLMKNLIKLKFKTYSMEDVLTDVSKLLLNVSNDIVVPETLSIKEELTWMLRGLKTTPHCQAVIERLCEITGASFESVLASDADRMEIGDNEESTIDLDTSSFIDQIPQPTMENLSKLNRYWRCAIKEKNPKDQQRILTKACRLVEKYVTSGGSYEDFLSISPITKTILKTFTEIVQNKKFGIRYPMVDLCFELISFATNVNQGDDGLLVEAVELLFSICKVRMPLVVDRIPAFYKCYNSLFVKVAKRACECDHDDVENLVCAAHKLEKLTDVLQKHKKDFVKTAITAVADFIGVFAEYNVEDSVKMHLRNIIYCWIGISDIHVHQFLSSKLAPSSLKLFQQYCSDYNKYYKFSGKV